MIGFVENLLLIKPLEFYTAVIATLGVAFWFLDRRSMKAALTETRRAEINALRLERQKTEASVEQSFAMLQTQCQVARNAWLEHERRNGPMLRSPRYVSEERKEIQRVELTAGSRLTQLKASAPKSDTFEISVLEAYFTAANRTSLEFSRLASLLPDPKNSLH